MNICSIFYIVSFRFLFTTVSRWLEKNNSPLRLISGIANLKTQGILQIDWKESRSVYSKQSRDCVGQRCQVKWVWECLGATFLKLRLWPKKKQWLQMMWKIKIHKLFDSYTLSTFHAPRVMMFFIFSPLWHKLPWYNMIWRNLSAIVFLSSIIVVDGDVVEYC